MRIVLFKDGKMVFFVINTFLMLKDFKICCVPESTGNGKCASYLPVNGLL